MIMGRNNLNPSHKEEALVKCFFMTLLFAAAGFCHGNDLTTFEVVGIVECADCNLNGIKANHAFSGLRVTIDCKKGGSGWKTRGEGEVNEDGKFKVLVSNKEMEILESGELKEKCYAQLHSASSSSSSSTPCKLLDHDHDDALESSKIVFKSKSDGKHSFGLANNGLSLKFRSETCPSAFLWPYFHHHPPLPHISFPPLIGHGHPYLFPPLPPKVFPPIFKKPLPPPAPVYKPIPPPVYKPKPPPVYEPKPPPVYKPKPPPVYEPKPPPVYEPKPPPVYTPKPPPICSPKPKPPPVYKPKPKPPPVYKPKPKPPPIYKPPTPIIVPPPVPVYVKPVPPPVPYYKHPWFKHLPPIPKVIPPIYKKPFPCPPLPKVLTHPKFGKFPPHPPLLLDPHHP